MKKYKSLKNIHFKSIDKDVLENGIIELDEEFANRVNEDLKLTFPDVPNVLISLDGADEVTEEKAEEVVDEVVEEVAEKPARKPRKQKTEKAEAE
ncbi:hypothetical protein MX111_11025 [Streptococcus uberis]|uniref:hypothetical protein n=1 Tax=Streptococcus uberis TaxID=1349 RepID=UPI0027DD8D16|nr:hypothetical protein [Streptococcus uberis]MCK1239879.1 hypothetical protein [Streptococcus uberis]